MYVIMLEWNNYQLTVSLCLYNYKKKTQHGLFQLMRGQM